MQTLAFAGITVALFGCLDATMQGDAGKLKIGMDYAVPLSGGGADNPKIKVEVKINIKKAPIKNDILTVSGTVTETTTSKSSKIPVSNKNVDKHVSVDTVPFDVDIRESNTPGKYEWFAAGTPSNSIATSRKFSHYHSDMGNALVSIMENL